MERIREFYVVRCLTRKAHINNNRVYCGDEWSEAYALSFAKSKAYQTRDDVRVIKMVLRGSIKMSEETIATYKYVLGFLGEYVYMEGE